ncbi:MAG: hypothetical protein O3A04_08165 [Actinomycetota bacterium]|nr:hypothetical protein [Actinomycetota bacterium]
MARQSNVAKVPLRFRKDLFGIRGHDHDVVAVAHPPEAVVEVIEIKVGQHGGEARARTEAIRPQERVDLPPDRWVEAIHQPPQTLLVDRGEVTLDVESDSLPLKFFYMPNRCVDAVPLAITVYPVSQMRQDKFVDVLLN